MPTPDTVDLLERLVGIESHDSVAAVRDYLLECLPNARVHPESGCVVATKGHKSPENGHHVFLNSHMDVVPPHLEPSRDGDILRARGACDAKGCLTALIRGFVGVEPTDGGVTLVISPDEETTSEGLYDYLSLEAERGDMAIVGEPTGLDVCNAAHGSFKYRVEITGSAAHSGSRESGRSAISCAGEAIQAIEGIEGTTGEAYNDPDQTIVWIAGGPVDRIASQVPEECRLFVNRFTGPEETPDAYKAMLEDELEGLACEVSVHEPYLPNRFLEGYTVDPDTYVIQTMVDAVASNGGSTAKVRPFEAAAESAFFARQMPVAVFGPGRISDEEGPIAHSGREYVDTEDVKTAAGVIEEFLATTV